MSYQQYRQYPSPTTKMLGVFVVVAFFVCMGGGAYVWKFKPDLLSSIGRTAVAQGCGSVDVLDGYTLPAKSGRTGKEEAIDSNGAIPDGETVTFKHLAKHGANYRDYYITMRWNYAEWDWNGDSRVIDSKQRDWMALTPRLVLVTNTKNNKKIIAAALESGPAPWTGVDRERNNQPKQGWKNPQTSTTPPGYTGRVSGFPPKAMEALDAEQGMYTGKGDILNYAWADQTKKPGPCE